MRRTIILATLAALCATFAIAPATSMAKKVLYSGPVNLPFVPSPAGFATDRPAIELKIRFDGKTPVAVQGGTVKTQGLYSSCVAHSYGCDDYCSDATGCEPLHCRIASSLFEEAENGFKVKKNRRFAGTLHAPFGDSFLAVTGRVGKGTVSGTIRAHYVLPTRPSDGANATCDTGVVSWTATR
jgi:hypothetical protein